MRDRDDIENTTTAPRFTLDREAAIEAIASVWGLPPNQDAWRLDRFGDSLGSSVENLAGVAFAPGRRLVDGPCAEVRVYAISDPHLFPVMVCLAGIRGPMLCTGVEDLTTALPEPWGASQELVLDALQTLLDVATETHAADPIFDPVEIFASAGASAAGTEKLLANSR